MLFRSGKPTGPSAVAQEVQAAAKTQPIEGEVIPKQKAAKKKAAKKEVTAKPAPEVKEDDDIPDTEVAPPIEAYDEDDPLAGV